MPCAFAASWPMAKRCAHTLSTPGTSPSAGDPGREALADEAADDVVADEVLLDRLVDAGLGGVADDRHRARERQADHQRRGRRGRTPRVAQGVLAGQRSDRSEQAAIQPRGRGQQRIADHGAGGRDAEQDRQDAAADEVARVRTPPRRGRRSAHRHRRASAPRRSATGAAQRRLGHRDVVAHGLDGRDLGWSDGPGRTPRPWSRSRRRRTPPGRSSEPGSAAARTGRARTARRGCGCPWPAGRRGRARWSSRAGRGSAPRGAPSE